MKNLARLIIVCFAAQLLSVGIVNANVLSNKTGEKTAVCAMPNDGDGGDTGEGPFEGF